MKKTRGRKKWLWIWFVTILVFVGITNKKLFRLKDKPFPYRTVTVARGPIRQAILATGTVQPQSRLEVKAQIAGRMDRVLAIEGKPVKKGQTLAWMSSVERAALMDGARAKGRIELAHWNKLYKPTPILAPKNGILIARNVEDGQAIQPTDALFVISDRLIVRADVDETDMSRVKLGQEAEVIVDAFPKSPFIAKVSRVAYDAKIVNNVTVYEVELSPGDSPEFLRSGMTAEASFVLAKKDSTLLLPAEAVHQEEGKPAVFVENEKGANKKPRTLEVQLGLNDGKHVEVTEGLSEGDTVLVPDLTILAKKAKKATNPFAPRGAKPGK